MPLPSRTSKTTTTVAISKSLTTLQDISSLPLMRDDRKNSQGISVRNTFLLKCLMMLGLLDSALAQVQYGFFGFHGNNSIYQIVAGQAGNPEVRDSVYNHLRNKACGVESVGWHNEDELVIREPIIIARGCNIFKVKQGNLSTLVLDECLRILVRQAVTAAGIDQETAAANNTANQTENTGLNFAAIIGISVGVSLAFLLLAFSAYLGIRKYIQRTALPEFKEAEEIKEVKALSF